MKHDWGASVGPAGHVTVNADKCGWTFYDKCLRPLLRPWYPLSVYAKDWTVFVYGEDHLLAEIFADGGVLRNREWLLLMFKGLRQVAYELNRDNETRRADREANTAALQLLRRQPQRHWLLENAGLVNFD